MKKYPRTFHFHFSPEIHSDDKVIDPSCYQNFINTEVIITEKLDGQNSCFKGHQGVFARSHQVETKNQWDTLLKQHYYNNLHLIDSDIYYFLENLYAVHSIEYTDLKSSFFMFAAFLNKRGIWADWDLVDQLAESIGANTVPVLYRGEFKSVSDIKDWMDSEILKPSELGGEREGFVLRIADEFSVNDFSKKVAKYVRRGHVQNKSEHWTKNWKKAKF